MITLHNTYEMQNQNIKNDTFENSSIYAPTLMHSVTSSSQMSSTTIISKGEEKILAYLQ